MFQVVEELKTHISCSRTIFFFKNRIAFEITWKNMVQPDRPQMIIRRMRFACWITKVTDTHSEYVKTYCLSTATMVTRTRLYVMFIRILPVFFRWNPISKGIRYRITQLLLLCCNIQGDLEGKVCILGGDVTGHCERNKAHMNTYLILNSYRDRIVWIYKQKSTVNCNKEENNLLAVNLSLI